MSEKQDERNRRALDIALDTRKFEISLFWQRSLFFWGFNSAAFAAYGSLYKSRKSDIDLLVAIICVGFVISVVWTLGNRGSRYWHQVWENKLNKCEEAVLGGSVTELTKDYWSITRTHFLGSWFHRLHFSVSRLTIALSDFFVLVWVVLFFYTIPGSVPRFCDSWVWMPIATLIYVAYMVRETLTDPKCQARTPDV